MAKIKDEVEDNIPENIIYKSANITSCVKSTNEEGEEIGVFYGAMATQDVDRVNDIIAPEAFDDSIKRYKKLKRRVKLYYQHDVWSPPIGGIEPKNVTQEGKDWNIKGELDLNNPEAVTIYSALKKGNLTDLSIGFSILDYEYNKKEQRVIKELELWEVSVVGEPANSKATITNVKGAKVLKDLPLADKEQSEGDVDKYSYEDVRYISQPEEVNALLKDSGMFTRGAREHVVSLFRKSNQSNSGEKTNPNQSNSGKETNVNDFIIKQKLNDLVELLKLITNKGK